MEDKIIMNTVLTLTKNACDIFMHGAIESNTKEIKTCFTDSLDKYLKIQGELFTSMESGGLYNIENIPETKIEKSKKKYVSSLDN
jgi:spore coat protein CotF